MKLNTKLCNIKYDISRHCSYLFVIIIGRTCYYDWSGLHIVLTRREPSQIWSKFIPDRPILSRGETIDSCCSEDLVTVLEVNKKEEKRPFKVIDRFRLFRKGIMAATLEDLIIKGLWVRKKTQQTECGCNVS